MGIQQRKGKGKKEKEDPRVPPASTPIDDEQQEAIVKLFEADFRRDNALFLRLFYVVAVLAVMVQLFFIIHSGGTFADVDAPSKLYGGGGALGLGSKASAESPLAWLTRKAQHDPLFPQQCCSAAGIVVSLLSMVIAKRASDFPEINKKVEDDDATDSSTGSSRYVCNDQPEARLALAIVTAVTFIVHAAATYLGDIPSVWDLVSAVVPVLVIVLLYICAWQARDVALKLEALRRAKYTCLGV